MSAPDEIWNRAVWAEGDLSAWKTGDHALHGAIEFASFAENGGMAHALEVSGLEPSVAAVSGFRFFGLVPVAVVVERAISVVTPEVLRLDHDDRQEAFFRRPGPEADPLRELEESYGALGPWEALEAAFPRVLVAQPSEFAELSTEDVAAEAERRRRWWQ